MLLLLLDDEEERKMDGTRLHAKGVGKSLHVIISAPREDIKALKDVG
jgi:hypothetical protein